MRASAPAHPYGMVWLMAVSALAGSCNSTEPFSVPLARYLSVAPPIVATDALLPLPPGLPGQRGGDDSPEPANIMSRLDRSITTSLHPIRAQDPSQPALWRVDATSAHVSLDVVSAQDSILRMEIRPYSKGPDAERKMTVELNGSKLRTLVLPPRWATVDVELPGSRLRPGRNQLRLEFSHAVPLPSAPGKPARGSAARLRSLQLVSPLGRPPWPHGAPAVQVPGPRTPGPILMPTDSLIQIALDVPHGARLRAEIDARPTNGEAPGMMHATVEVVESKGNTSSVIELFVAHFEAPARLSPEPLGGPRRQGSDEAPPESQGGPRRQGSDEARAGSQDEPRQLEASLDRWSGKRIMLRFRSTGNVNGIVSWEHLRLEYRASRSAPDPVLGASALDLRPAPRSGRWGKPDLLVILLDAARADAFSPYGARRPTPKIQALAEAGTVVLRALSAAPWTAPAITSLLTGRLPDAHGVESWTAPLEQSIPTLPALLADAGYHTVLWSHHVVWRGNRSLRRGFENITDVQHMDRERVPTAAELFVPNRPTFALVHLVLPHQPYEPPPPYRGLYTQDNRDVSSTALRRLSTPLLGPRPSGARTASAVEMSRIARDRYDETVAWTDAKVGELLEVVRTAGRFDDALIVLVADHGEAFYEHGAFLHTRLLYDEMLRVPMIFKWPASSADYPATLPGPVSIIDLAPTLVDGIGIGAGARFQGHSLLPEVFDHRAPGRRMLYARTVGNHDGRVPAQPKTALELGGYKLLVDPAGDGPELYDLTSDPGERLNLAHERPILTRWLLQRLLAQQHRNALLHRDLDGETARELDPQVLRDLRALGYVR